MGVERMRSTKIAPLSLSTSYLTGSASFGISMTTLISFGTSRPALTISRPMGYSLHLPKRGKLLRIRQTLPQRTKKGLPGIYAVQAGADKHMAKAGLIGRLRVGRIGMSPGKYGPAGAPASRPS